MKRRSNSSSNLQRLDDQQQQQYTNIQNDQQQSDTNEPTNPPVWDKSNNIDVNDVDDIDPYEKDDRFLTPNVIALQHNKNKYSIFSNYKTKLCWCFGPRITHRMRTFICIVVLVPITITLILLIINYSMENHLFPFIENFTNTTTTGDKLTTTTTTMDERYKERTAFAIAVPT